MINARGGSRGIPRKNIKSFLGKPLIAHSIELALKIKEIDEVIVSTDDKKIADIAQKYGATIPFMRPKKLATSKSLQIDTIVYNLKKFEKIKKREIDLVVLLQPTAPLRNADDVIGCIKLMKKKNPDTVISIADVGCKHPSGIYRVGKDESLIPFVKKSKSGFNRQQLEKIYWRTGSVYVIQRNVILKNNAIYGDKIIGYKVSEERAFNIDTKFDWKLAELWGKYKKNYER